MRHSRKLSAFAAAVWVLGCSDSPTAPHDHELIVDFAISTEHIHTLDAVTFTVTVTDEHGDYVTDFTSLAVEYELEGSATWRPIELVLEGTAYVGTFTFVTSGDYHFRVAGMQASDTQDQVLYESPEHMEVGRAHEVLADYRIEFESFPGHLHEGEEATFRFWILTRDENAMGERDAIAGLSVIIECGNPDATSELHSVSDNVDGIYETAHLFEEGGEAHMAIRFTDSAGVEQEADFHVHVAHAH